MNVLKRLHHISPYQRWMLAIVAIATLLRLALIYFHWPLTDGDEGNMGVLALHVAFKGDHPVFFYGGNYLGPLEGYAAAPLFRLFGASLFALRLPLVLFFVGFLLGMYYLVRLLYRSEKFALASVIVLGLGSPDVLFLQLRASGEYPELEMLAALMCALAVWLALTSYQAVHKAGARERWKRILIYGLLGLIMGLALWVDLLILPFAAGVIVLLCLFCRREVLSWSGLSFLVGLVVGAFPLIYYNLTAPWSQNSWFVLQQLDHSGAAAMLAQHLTWVNQLSGTLFVALPMATGGSLHCPLNALPPTGTPTPATLPCVVFQGVWGAGYIILGLVAAALALYALWRNRFRLHTTLPQSDLFEKRQEMIRQCGRLVLLAGAGLTLLLYAISPSPATVPDTSFRYLTCLILAIPALLWPIWHGLSGKTFSNQRVHVKIGMLLGVGALLLVAATFVSGTVRAYQDIPTVEARYHSEEAMVQELLGIGATRVYSDFGTCGTLTFFSQEKIICSALTPNLSNGYDRYLPYRAIVQAAPHPTYIFPPDIPQAAAIQRRVLLTGAHYHYYTFEGYVVYQMT